MSASQQAYSFAFTDIVGSTETKRLLGDSEYFRVLEEHNARIREITGQDGDTAGDSFFLKFSTAAEAVKACVQVQRSFRDKPIQAGKKALAIRIGIDFGDAILFSHPDGRADASGTFVDQAARYEALASGGQIMVSDRVHSQLRGRDSEIPGITLHDCGEHELKGAGRQRVYEVLWDGKVAVPPSGPAKPSPPSELAPFVGRKADLRKIKSYLSDPKYRLIVLQGPGGVGKTRLAIEVRRQFAEMFDEGVFFVELESVANSAEAVESQIRIDCGAADGPLEHFFRNKSALLILNNWETAVAARGFIAALLKSCNRLKILATSQVSMEIAGEQVWWVDPLADGDAKEMFVSYALRHDPDFTVTRLNADLWKRLLKATDRMPFCLELAAAMVRRGASIEWIIEGVEQSLHRFASIAMPSGRHQSVTACLDWSLNLVGALERELYPKLAVFQGGFLAKDVATICSEPEAPTLLEHLRGASLLRFSEDRYVMLPTAIEYSRDKLGPRMAELRERHAEHYLSKLQVARERRRGSDAAKAQAWMRAEFENCRAGMEWAVDSKQDKVTIAFAHALAGSLAATKRAPEAIKFCEEGLAAARRIGEEGLAAARRIGEEEVANAENNLGNAYSDLPGGDRAENLHKAIACYEAALHVWTERDFPLDWAMTQNNLGNAYSNLPGGDREENLRRAITCYEAALHVWTERDFPTQWAATQNNLGNAYTRTFRGGDREENLRRAITCYEAALRVRTEHDFPLDWAVTQNNLGTAYSDLPGGDGEENLWRAITCYDAALRVRTEKDFPLEWATTQNNLGTVYSDLPGGDREENLRRAITCYEAALRVRTEHDFPLDWAMTQSNLGTAYSDLPGGDREENLRTAIACWENAIRAYRSVGVHEEADKLEPHLTKLRAGLDTIRGDPADEDPKHPRKKGSQKKT